MDEHVVNEGVDGAVRRDTDGDPPHPRHRAPAEEEQADADRSEDQREPIVALQPTAPRLMVAAVPAVRDAVHHPSMGGVAHGFHADKTHDHEGERAHAADLAAARPA